MDVHRRHQPRVVHFDADYAMPHDQFFPLRVEWRCIRKKLQILLDVRNLRQRDGRRKAQPIMRRGAGRDVLELCYIL